MNRQWPKEDFERYVRAMPQSEAQTALIFLVNFIAENVIGTSELERKLGEAMETLNLSALSDIELIHHVESRELTELERELIERLRYWPERIENYCADECPRQCD